MKMPWAYSDGGRAAAGFGASTRKRRDCVVRAIAIGTGHPYSAVWAELVRLAAKHERPRDGKGCSHPELTGVSRATGDRYMRSVPGWAWTPTMGIGTGCKVHLRPEELPSGRLIASLSRHWVAVIDGVVFDTTDPGRGGTRCVYGFWHKTG